MSNLLGLLPFYRFFLFAQVTDANGRRPLTAKYAGKIVTTDMDSRKLDGKIRLCPRCMDLRLSANHFKVGRLSDDGSQRGVFAPYEGLPNKISSNFSIRTGNSRKFATIEELRLTCPICDLCWLALEAIERYSSKSLPRVTQCLLTWEVDGRSETTSSNGDRFGQSIRNINKTRRLKLSWPTGTTGDAGQVYLVLAVPPGRPGQIRNSLFPPLQDTHSLGRVFHDHAEKQTLMRHWLSSCCDEHQSTCESTHGNTEDFMQIVEGTYFGVIDVLEMCLTQLPREKDTQRRPKRYVALSYVWGRSLEKPYVTTEYNVMAHVMPGGLATVWSKLPRTIQDAILLVSRLGERYLWVDSLCIAQDDRRSWYNNAKAMHLIYGHAYFTICAADGDASQGLRAVGPMLREFQSFHYPNGNGEYPTDYGDTTPLSVQYADGLRILVTRPLDVVIHDSTWSKRAWTFQEQILSRRCLIFAEGRVYYQCRFAKVSEDIWTDNKGNGWSLNRTNSPLQSPDQIKSRPIWFYMNFVRQFTGRHLTMEKDILAAFEGIAWLLQEHLDQERFLFGLPPSHFDLALLWIPSKALRRRRKMKSHSPSSTTCPYNQTFSENDAGLCLCTISDTSLEGAEFPSWSWCGWMKDERSEFQVTYDEEILAGCLTNVSQWLERHTWIRWFVRDEKGHLRPLRNSVKRTQRKDLHEEDRWRGYSASSTWEPSLDPDYSTTYSDNRSTSRRQRPTSSVRWADAPPSRSASDDNRERVPSTQFVEYRVGPGGYTRRGSQAQPALTSADQKDRESSLTRYYQGLHSKSPDTQRSSSPTAISEGDEFDIDARNIDARTPETPFVTIRASKPYISRPQGRPTNNFGQFPGLEQMAILQFHTAFKKLYVTIREPAPDNYGDLCACDIADDYGDWCGCVMVARSWIEKWQNQRLDFIAISEAREFTKEECPVWTYYIPKEREESQWDLFYVLLLERDEERCVWERVALGKVFQAPFEDAIWTEVKLG